MRGRSASFSREGHHEAFGTGGRFPFGMRRTGFVGGTLPIHPLTGARRPLQDQDIQAQARGTGCIPATLSTDASGGPRIAVAATSTGALQVPPETRRPRRYTICRNIPKPPESSDRAAAASSLANTAALDCARIPRAGHPQRPAHPSKLRQLAVSRPSAALSSLQRVPAW